MTRSGDRSLAGCIVVALLLTGCSASATQAEARDRGFLLTISSPRQTWAAGEPIEVSAALSYLGPAATQVWGPGPGGHIGFDLVELNGRRKLQAAWHLACQSWLMTRNPITTAFRKSGGWSADDPDVDWYEAFLADPEFRLPAGRWRVTATAPFSLGPDACGGPSVDLRASVTLIVE